MPKALSFNYSADDARFMQMVIDLSVDNIDTGGGPFGAVIMRDEPLAAFRKWDAKDDKVRY